MAEIIRKAAKGYKLLFIDLVDHRMENYFLLAKPYQGLLLLGIYLMFVFKWGPHWMKNRRPFNLEKVLIVYNAVQAIICGILFLTGLRYWGWGGIYRWVCEPVDFSNSEAAMFTANLCYCYYLLKVFDLLDTVFFVLRKKQNQVSFLHVYHHAGMVMLIWAAATYYPGGHATLVGFVNCFVHVVMYTYYLLTIAVPTVKNMMWIKKLVTQLQIIQFFIFVVHMGGIIFKPDCQYPRWTAAIFLPQNLFMLILFTDFYIKTYIKGAKTKKSDPNDMNDTNDEVTELAYTKNSNGKMMLNKNGIIRTSELNVDSFRARNTNHNNIER